MRIGEDGIVAMYEETAYFNNCLKIQKNPASFCYSRRTHWVFLTPPGTKTLCIVAPRNGTTCGSGDPTPGLIPSDSFKTVVYKQKIQLIRPWNIIL